jgi:hypothetical protein
MISTRAMRKQCPSVLQPPFFVMRPILVCLHPKAGMAFPQPWKSLRGWGGGKVFPTPGDPKSALYRIWFNAYLTT